MSPTRPLLLLLLLASVGPPPADAGQCVRYEWAYACEGYENAQGVPTFAEVGARRAWTAETPAVGDRVPATATPILVSFAVGVKAPSGAGESGAGARTAIHVGSFRAGDPVSVVIVDTDGDGIPEDFGSTPAIGPFSWPRAPRVPLPDLDGYVPQVRVPRVILPGLP